MNCCHDGCRRCSSFADDESASRMQLAVDLGLWEEAAALADEYLSSVRLAVPSDRGKLDAALAKRGLTTAEEAGLPGFLIVPSA